MGRGGLFGELGGVGDLGFEFFEGFFGVGVFGLGAAVGGVLAYVEVAAGGFAGQDLAVFGLSRQQVGPVGSGARVFWGVGTQLPFSRWWFSRWWFSGMVLSGS